MRWLSGLKALPTTLKNAQAELVKRKTSSLSYPLSSAKAPHTHTHNHPTNQPINKYKNMPIFRVQAQFMKCSLRKQGLSWDVQQQSKSKESEPLQW